MRRRSFSGPSRTLNKTTRVESSLLDRIRNNTNRNTQTHLEEIVDLDRDLEIYRNNDIILLNPWQLYQVGFLRSNTRLFRSSREESLSVTIEAKTLKLITRNSIK